jgi:hypothetical protein
MTGLVRKAVLLAAIALLAASAAMAGIPDPTKCSVPNCVLLLPGACDGYVDGGTSGYQPYTVVVRDVTNAPIAGITVIIDISCQDDVKLADTQCAPIVLDAATNVVYQTTDGTGTATFVVRGAGKNSLPAGGIGPGSMIQTRIFAGSTFLKAIHAVTPDENGAGDAGTVVNGLDPGDGAFFQYDLFNYSATAGRSDINCSGVVDPADGAWRRDHQFNDPTSVAPQVTTYNPNLPGCGQ